MQILTRLLYAQLGIDHTYASAHVPKVTMRRPFDPNPSHSVILSQLLGWKVRTGIIGPTDRRKPTCRRV
jgi:hypothetical protein